MKPRKHYTSECKAQAVGLLAPVPELAEELRVSSNRRAGAPELPPDREGTRP